MRIAVLLIWLVVAVIPAAGDEIVLRRGDVIVGRIVSQNAVNVTIDTMVNGVRATLTFPRSQIRTIERGDIPDSYFDVPEPVEDELSEGFDDGVEEPGELPGDSSVTARTVDAVPGALRYLAIPLQGEVGREITARGVRDALRMARRAQADAVVFVIETDGGRVIEADAIARVIEVERDNLRIFSVVSRAISVGIWPLSRSDRIFFEPGATAGAAVTYAHSRSTGSVEVDAKLNAATAARLVAAAEARGQSGCIYRAMVLMEAGLYRWTDAEGRVHVANTPAPPDAIDSVQIVSETGVLAITTRQAVELGFAEELPGRDLAAIGDLIQAPGWVLIGENAALAMHQAQRDLERRARSVELAQDRIRRTRERVAELASQVEQGRAYAIAADPGRLRIYHRGSSGTMTPESQMRWRQQTDEAVAKWNGVLASIGQLRTAERRAEQAIEQFNTALSREWEARLYLEEPDPLDLPPVDHGLDLAALEREANEKKLQLIARRSRTNIAR
jgi:hypothetical protein